MIGKKGLGTEKKKDILSGMELKKGLNIDQIFRKTYKPQSILMLGIGLEFSKPTF